MTDKHRYMSVTVEYGQVEYDSEGNGVVSNDHSDTFDITDPVASFLDLFDDLSFEVRNGLE